MRSFPLAATLALLIGSLGCQSDAHHPPPDPGVKLPPTNELSAEDAAMLATIDAERAATKSMTTDAFLTRYHVPFLGTLPYDPFAATNLGKILGSSLGLDAVELAHLKKDGFAITDRHRFPSFVYGYETIYSQDLPVYVSADSVLYAVHQSYDKILQMIEKTSLKPSLASMLQTMRAQLASGAGASLDAEARADADLLLAVALSLLTDTLVEPVAEASLEMIASYFAHAKAAAGVSALDLFGTPREIDFSQFKPRGHYVGDPMLEGYFRAMMWLGRTELRFLETLPDHSQVLRRRQIRGALAIRALMNEAARANWQKVDDTVRAFVGDVDDMSMPQLDAFAADLALASPDDVDHRADEQLRKALLSGKYASPRILSQIMRNGLQSGTMPFSISFLVLGQRYVLDSHVFSNVVFDRAGGGASLRMMPNPLDVAFAALRNDQGGALLASELTTYSYAPDLHMMRFLADAHGDAYWQKNLYNLWLSSLRALSPTSEIAKPVESGLPSVAATEPWGRRILQTQLASWAELRHDTVLYVKQSYTGGAACTFPDAYVDPYPAFYARIFDFATRGRKVIDGLAFDDTYSQTLIADYFDRLAIVASTLREMAENQRKGLPLTADHLKFINEAVKVSHPCGTSRATGWYARLMFNPNKGVELDPVIADVHTQPTDAGGATVGHVLHVGTGMPRAMVVTVGGLDGCSGSRAYVGLASSYFETITDDFRRYTDIEWAAKIKEANPPDVPWMTDLVRR